MMTDEITNIQDVQVFVCAPDGKKLASEQDAVDVIGEALYAGVEMVVVPVERLDEDFFQLKSGLAGHFIQKFVTYRRRLVVLGDISEYVARSHSFRDFVYETNRGDQVWFLADLQELEGRLKRT
jgi:hypothetical protein